MSKRRGPKVHLTEEGRLERIGSGQIVTRFQRTPWPPEKPDDIVCPGFLHLKWAWGCPHECAWCYLQGTFWRHPSGKAPRFKDQDKVMGHLATAFGSDAQPEMMNAGEICDAAMGELELEGAWSLPSVFSALCLASTVTVAEGWRLLLLTKNPGLLLGNFALSLHVDGQAPMADWIVVSTTLNTFSVAERWEQGAPAVPDRIQALEEIAHLGYETRVRIDPILPHPTKARWAKELTVLADAIARIEPPVARVTLGTPRARPNILAHAADKSWAESATEPSGWGNRIPFKQRLWMYQQARAWLQAAGYIGPVAICKETRRMWAAFAGGDWQHRQCNCQG